MFKETEDKMDQTSKKIFKHFKNLNNNSRTFKLIIEIKNFIVAFSSKLDVAKWMKTPLKNREVHE